VLYLQAPRLAGLTNRSRSAALIFEGIFRIELVRHLSASMPEKKPQHIEKLNGNYARYCVKPV
jgi:hypothetical protein